MYRFLLPFVLYNVIAIIALLIMKYVLNKEWNVAIGLGAFLFAGLAVIDRVLFNFFDIEVARVIVNVISK